MECTLCRQDKPRSAFYRGRRQCKRCRLDQKIASYDPAKQKLRNDRASWRIRAQRYNISEESLLQMWADQGERCAICSRATDKPHVDHCHQTGRVRGLLCASCNRVLGLVRDSAERLRTAAEYLER